jgi:hypothetical protein
MEWDVYAAPGPKIKDTRPAAKTGQPLGLIVARAARERVTTAAVLARLRGGAPPQYLDP